MWRLILLLFNAVVSNGYCVMCVWMCPIFLFLFLFLFFLFLSFMHCSKSQGSPLLNEMLISEEMAVCAYTRVLMVVFLHVCGIMCVRSLSFSFFFSLLYTTIARLIFHLLLCTVAGEMMAYLVYTYIYSCVW